MARRTTARQIMGALDEHRRSTDALDRLDGARRVREGAEELESLAVMAARQSGVTWSEIGRCYGLTKQGAQQRFHAIRRGVLTG